MVDDGMDVDVVIDGEVDGTIVVTIEVDNVEDFVEVANDDMNVVDENVADVLLVDKVFASVIDEEVGTFININHQIKFFEVKEEKMV